MYVTKVLVPQAGWSCPDFHKHKRTAHHFKVAKYDAKFWKKNKKKGA